MASISSENITCNICNKILPTDKFSRAQKKKWKNKKPAKCKSCVECEITNNGLHASDNNQFFFVAPEGVVVMTMWQPWASLLVYGVKRVEGRPWGTSHRGRMWIHASGNATENLEENINNTVEYYKKNVYSNFDNILYPKHYPTSVIVGCVDVVDVITKEQFQKYTENDRGMRSESSSESCFICTNPQRLLVPYSLGTTKMKGNGMLWTITKKMEAAMLEQLVPCNTYVTKSI
jgi:hypothetical protein